MSSHTIPQSDQTHEDFDTLVSQGVGVFEGAIASQYLEVLTSAFAASEISVPHGVVIELGDGNDGAFIGSVDMRSLSEAKLYYERAAVEEAALEFDDSVHTFAALERVYIFGSLSWAILQNAMRASNQEARHLFNERLVDTTSLETDIANQSGLSYYEKGYLLIAIREANDDSNLDRLCQIQELRLIAGLYSELCPDNNGNLTGMAMNNIKNALLNRAMLGVITRHITRIEDVDAHLRKMFTDSPSELSLALAFPMSHDELQNIIEVATTDSAGERLDTNEDIREELPTDGFHEE